MSTKRLAWVVLLALLLQPVGFVAQAQILQFDDGFNPNRVLEDSDIFDVNGMGYDRIVDFLRSKGTLATYRTKDIDGVIKTVPEIIWRVAHSYKINPKYLMALIQKEQSLVEDPNPTQKKFDWATGYGVCDTCSKDDPSIQDFKGFASQVEWAAKQHREKYLMQLLGNGQTRAGKAPGKAMAVDGLTVTPANNATAMLYSYTPHINGNLNLWHIWRRWFSLQFPDGTVARGKSSGKTYLIRRGEKRAFSSHAVMESLIDPAKVVVVSDTELAAYPNGKAIEFPKFALLRDTTKRIWLLTGESRRLITDVKTFKKFGFNEDEVIDIDSDSELNDYPIGEAITTKTEFPQGVVLQNKTDKTDKTYWYVEGTSKQRIPDKVFLTLYFQRRSIKSATAQKLATYTTGDVYKLHSGELVRSKSSPSVYVVENTLLRPIPNAEIFSSLGWQWKNVVTVPDSVISGYTVGTPVLAQPLQRTSSLL